MSDSLPLRRIGPVSESARAFALKDVLKDIPGTHLHISLDAARLSALEDTLEWRAPEWQVLSFPAWDVMPYDRVSPNGNVVAKRIATLAELAAHPAAEGKRRVVLTTVNAFLQKVVEPVFFEKRQKLLKPGSTASMESLLAFLTANGYRRIGKVMEPGDVAVRGGILDIYPAGQEEPVRLDFFGDEVESIRTFDAFSQTTTGKLDALRLLPMSEVVLNEESVNRFREGYRSHFGAVLKEDPLYEAVSARQEFPGMEHWLPLFHERLATLLDYLPPTVSVTIDHLADRAMIDRLEQIRDNYQNRKTTKATPGAPVYHPLPADALYWDEDRLRDWFDAAPITEFSPFRPAENDQTATVLAYRIAPTFAAERRQGGALYDKLREYVANHQREGRMIVVGAATTGSMERLRKMLTDHRFGVATMEHWNGLAAPDVVHLAILPLETGVETPEIALLTEQDLFGERVIRSSKRKRKAERFMDEAASLIPGELVVHRDHGIGRFEGLVTLTVSDIPHDCLKLVYEDEDKLFVPVENIEMVIRYGSEETAKLDKLGGASWQARKARLKERIKLAAAELLKVAAEREVKKAAVLPEPEEAYDEFCARFPYAETEDQLRSIEEIIEDFRKGRPTDRLICGDVGFGKTEVALRAAFIAAGGGENPERKQVALICPTTLLCRQHYRTFRQRFEGFPITVRMLSRLVSAKEAAETRDGLKEGTVDVVIGTHALLSKEVHFKNLVLLIVDEEQHFGVAQKEKLKKLKSDVHVISLSATPIPRTMQMALTGIRDLSLITTPPVDRLAVRTFVMPFDPVVLREALLREKSRGGKTFYVAPRISDLAQLKQNVTELAPELKAEIVHGQMAPTQIDKIVTRFDEGGLDVLISTNIVESGLDIPHANTIIIHRADMFGLSQLYQLRGRVGRGKLRAYAYLTTPYGKALGQTAQKRLEVMHALDTLGGGFTVASHDMDIRGFGNLVGEEQSGHIREVGVELYQQMLEEAVRAARRQQQEQEREGERPLEEDWSPQINLARPVLIPEDYVSDIGLRLGLYKRAASLQSMEEIESFAAELIDRFGPLPDEVQNLLDVVGIKHLCRQASVERLDVGPKGLVIAFRNNQFSNPAALLDYINRHSQHAKVRPDQKLVIMREWKTEQEQMKGIQKALEQIAALAA